MSNIHKRIRASREERGLTREAFGTAIGASAAKVQALEGGRQRVDHPTLEAMSRNLGIDVNWLLLGADNHHALSAPGNENPTITRGNPDFVRIQRFDVVASAGHGSLTETEIGTGHYAFNRTWLDRRGLQPDNLSVIAVRGDSMEPELYDKDLILLDRTQNVPDDGGVYVVRYSGELFVKRIQKMLGGEMAMRSTNPFYGTIEIKPEQANDLEFVGKVVASMHEW